MFFIYLSGQWAHQNCNIIYKTALGKCIIETDLNEVGFVPQPHSPDITRHCSHTVKQKTDNIITPIHCPHTHTILVQINTLLFVPPRCHGPRRILISVSTRHGSVQREIEIERDKERKEERKKEIQTTRTSQGQRNETKQNKTKRELEKKQPDKKHAYNARKKRKEIKSRSAAIVTKEKGKKIRN